MARPYRGGGVLAPAPKGELTELRLGQLIDVWSVYNRASIRMGEIVYFIEAGNTPDPAAMDVLFRLNKAATALKHYAIPTRASKYRRLIIKNRSGNCYCFTVDPGAHRFYPVNTKEF